MDAAWAVPLNTALLIGLAYVQFRTNRKVDKKVDTVKKEATDARRAVGADRRRRHGIRDNGRRRRWTDEIPSIPYEEH
jgi:hypothetical protein